MTKQTIDDLSNENFDLKMQLSDAKAMNEFHRRAAILATLIGATGWVMLFAHIAWSIQR